MEFSIDTPVSKKIKNTSLRFLAGLLCLTASWTQAAIEPAGSVLGFTTESATNNTTIYHFQLSDGGTLVVYPYASDVIRVRWHWLGIYDKVDVSIDKPLDLWPETTSTITDVGATYLIKTALLDIEIVKSPTVQVHFKDKAGYYLLRDHRIEYNDEYQPINDTSYDRLRWTGAFPNGFKVKNLKVSPADEAYFGLGEYSGPLNRRGHSVQMWNSDTFDWKEFQSPLYMSFPFFYGVQPASGEHPAFTYGLFFNNTSRSVFHMASEFSNLYSFEGGDGQIDYFFFGGGANHGMQNVLKKYTMLTGYPTMLPRWAYGYHMSKWSYSEGDLVNVINQFRQNHIPVDAIYLDIDYFDQDFDDHYHDDLFQLTFNSAWTQPQNTFSWCHDQDVKVVAMVEPWLVPSDPKYTEAESLGHFVKDNSGTTQLTDVWFGPGSWLDFTSGFTRDWWKGKVSPFLSTYGIDGIWNDLNETADDGQIPLNGLYYFDGQFGTDNSNSVRWHQNAKNVHAIYETSTSYASLNEAHPNTRPFVLSRGGFPGIQKYALGWSGDNRANYDHLRHNIRVGSSVMISGMVNFGHDVGGFVSSTTPELLTRWHEWAVFNPFCRNHYGKFDVAKEPYLYDAYYKDVMVNSIRLRYRLMPYLYTLAYESHATGIPMNAPTVMYFTDDQQTFTNNDYDFMVGPNMLIAPVYEQGVDVRWVYLPAGTDWYSWHDDSKYVGGGWHEIAAPLGKTPIFVKQGAIIPTGPAVEQVQNYQPEYLDLHVWPATNSTFTLYEDDGISWDLLTGEFGRTTIACQKQPGQAIVNLAARTGSYGISNRALYVILHDMHLGEGDSVTLNGDTFLTDYSNDPDALYSAGQGWMYDYDKRWLHIKLTDDGNAAQLFVDIPSDPELPANKDTDGDGMKDLWETNNGLDLFNPNDAGDDLDHDGFSNLEEHTAGQDPNVADQGPFTSSYVSMSVVGAWNEWNPLNKNMRLTADDTWETTLSLSPGLNQFKFDANGGVALNWGDANASSAIPLNGIAQTDGPNITANISAAGTYRFTYNETTGSYSAEVDGIPVQWVGNSYHWPLAGEIDAGEDVWINTSSWPAGAAESARVVYTVDDGATWQAALMSKDHPKEGNDRWYVNLGSFPEGTLIRYAISASGSGNEIWDSNNGQDFTAQVNYNEGPGGPVEWIGDVNHYPANGNITQDDEVWTNIDTYPMDMAVQVRTVYSPDGGFTWISVPMAKGTPNGQNDHWYVNIGNFDPETDIQYAIEVTDGDGTHHWESNNGSNHHAFVD